MDGLELAAIVIGQPQPFAGVSSPSSAEIVALRAFMDLEHLDGRHRRASRRRAAAFNATGCFPGACMPLRKRPSRSVRARQASGRPAADVTKCFDRIERGRLTELLQKRIGDRRLRIPS